MNAPASASTLPFPEDLEATAEQVAEIRLLFPEKTPPYDAVGDWILIQERAVQTKKGSIWTTEETQARDRLDMNIGRVVSTGATAFRHPVSLQDEPQQFAVGDFVRIPRGIAADRPEEDGVVYRAVKLGVISCRLRKATAILR